MKPSRSSACAVVSNGIRESSHLHLNFAGGSFVGFGAGLVVMKFLRARYSSTLKSGPGGETNSVLPSGYGRAFRPLHVYGQNARSRGYQDRTQYQTEHSEEADTANHTDEDHQAAELGAPAEKQRAPHALHDGVAVLGVKRQNAAHAADNLVTIAKKVEHRENHHKKIENKLRDISQDGAEALGEKSRLFLDAPLHHLRYIGVGIQARNMLGDPRPLSRHRRRVLLRDGMLHAARNRNSFAHEQRGYRNGRNDEQNCHRQSAEDRGPPA